MSASPLVPSAHALEMAREVLQIEAAAVQALAGRLDDRFTRAVELLLRCKGRVVVSGIGKSGRTSIAPSLPRGTFLAIAIAASRSSASTR